MNKLELTQRLAQTLGHGGDAERAMEAFLQAVGDSLRAGDKVVLSGIGTLKPKLRKAQNRHNPHTMEPILVPPKWTVKFLPSKDLFPKQ